MTLSAVDTVCMVAVLAQPTRKKQVQSRCFVSSPLQGPHRPVQDAHLVVTQLNVTQLNTALSCPHSDCF